MTMAMGARQDKPAQQDQDKNSQRVTVPHGNSPGTKESRISTIDLSKGGTRQTGPTGQKMEEMPGAPVAFDQGG